MRLYNNTRFELKGYVHKFIELIHKNVFCEKNFDDNFKSQSTSIIF